jgi:hypothetical protein
MKLDLPLLRLPIRFEAEALAREALALPPFAWLPHPNRLPGNDAAPLVTPGGAVTDSVRGAMAPTAALRASPYTMEVMAAIGAVWGRSRLMRLAPGAEVPEHVDTNYYWRTHLRLHIPVVTTPEVLFTCGEETVHMAAGECWAFDTWRPHRVANGGSAGRIHLVLDTVGGERLWELMEAARGNADEPQPLPSGRSGLPPLTFETVNAPSIMSPWEVKSHIAFVIGEADPDPLVARIARRLDRFAAGWAAAWAQHGDGAGGLGEYRCLIEGVQRDLDSLGGSKLKLRNKMSLYRQLALLIFTVAVPEG